MSNKKLTLTPQQTLAAQAHGLNEIEALSMLNFLQHIKKCNNNETIIVIDIPQDKRDALEGLAAYGYHLLEKKDYNLDMDCIREAIIDCGIELYGELSRQRNENENRKD